VKACQAAALAANSLKADCSAPDDYFDTALALNLTTGKIVWSKRLQGYDVWIVPCIRPRAGVTCPSPSGPDYDLGGSGPNLLPHIVGFGQKSFVRRK
jgi:polyvinyl alcohol dehydrogenase (cytochrome)